MSDDATHLKHHEYRAVRELCRRLSRMDGVRPRYIWLFGSKARGDYNKDSDIDLLIVLDRVDWKRKERIHLADSRLSLEHDVLLNTHIVSRERWEELARHRATLWREIQRDGVQLYP